MPKDQQSRKLFIPKMSVGFIFPAFVSEYSGNEPDEIRKYSDGFDKLLEQVCLHSGVNLRELVLHVRNIPDHELNAQLISYVFSCAITDLLKENNVVPEFLAGYSMGLYAALYSSNSISFIQGIDLIKKAYELINASIPEVETGMGSIVGLTKEDVLNLLAKKEGVFLANTNGEHAFLISGLKPVVQTVLREAKLEGALHASLMNVNSPYHTPFLNNASLMFRDFILHHITLNDSTVKIISSVDQRAFIRKEEIIDELVLNLNTRINWLKTMERLLELGANRFVECGAGNSLYKAGKFIKGDFRIYTINSLDKFFGS